MAYPTHGPEYHERLGWIAPCRAATTANITIATALNAADVLDGVTLAAGDRVLVKNQTAGAENGVYIVGATPARAADYDSSGDIVGSVIVVSEGTANADTAWQCTTNATIVVGTTALVFASFGGGSGAPDTADYLVGTAQAGLSAEIVVGATPGGELGGTWASPTVDATHSGSTHAAAGSDHIADASAAHAASAVAFTPNGSIAATDVQAAIQEVRDEASGSGIPATIVDAKGDLIAATAADTVARVAVGTDGYFLKADSGAAAGVSWAAGGGGGVGAGIGAKAYHSTTQTINNTTASLLLDSEEFDTDGFHSISSDTERMTIPTGLGGRYLLVWHTHIPAHTVIASPQWVGWLRKNGSSTLRGSTMGANGANVDLQAWDGTASVLADLAAGDYIDIQMFTTDNIAFGHATGEYATSLSIMRIDSAGSGDVATDTIWVAAGDLVQATGNDAAAVLSAGTAGQLLKSAGAAAANVWSTAGEFVTGNTKIATSETTTSTSFADLATAGPSVTVTVGASGKVLVFLSCRTSNSNANVDAYVGVALSGANTVAASTLILHNSAAAEPLQLGTHTLLTGLTPGATTFKMQYAVAANTGTFVLRELTVAPVL